MKRLTCILLMLIGLARVSYPQEHRRYALIWNDEFNSGTLNTKVWSKIGRNNADWAIHMSPHDSLYAFEDGNLVLRGMANTFIPNDKAPFLTGGVWSKDRKAFGFGRVEVRAKFDWAHGYWPAIWMLPQLPKALHWPLGGEIDIMEHFRNEPFVNHTVHTYYTYNLRKRHNPPYVAYPKYNEGEFNTFGVERFQDSLVFFVNGRRTFCYPRFRKGVDGQFPFSNQDYYLILDTQLGREGSPYIDTTKLPVELRVDYVRYYELDTKTDVIPEPKEYQQFDTKKKRLRKVVYDTKTHFDNPDEYRLKVKCGKATISGNRHWAETTLAQLLDDEGCISNLEVHDCATCPYRGVSLNKFVNKLTFNELNKLLVIMEFYKLNYLQWKGEGNCSEEEVDIIREKAFDLGIKMVTDIPDIEADRIDFDCDDNRPASSRVFLQTASGNGGWFYLKGLELAEIEALAAFSERYWRGGSAGEGTVENGLPDTLSAAGTRLANFKEKLDVHKNRFHH